MSMIWFSIVSPWDKSINLNINSLHCKNYWESFQYQTATDRNRHSCWKQVENKLHVLLRRISCRMFTGNSGYQMASVLHHWRSYWDGIPVFMVRCTSHTNYHYTRIKCYRPRKVNNSYFSYLLNSINIFWILFTIRLELLELCCCYKCKLWCEFELYSLVQYYMYVLEVYRN